MLTARTAELALRQREQQPGFAVCLLQIVASDQFQLTTRLASALFFKNFVKRTWTVSTGPLPIRFDHALTQE